MPHEAVSEQVTGALMTLSQIIFSSSDYLFVLVVTCAALLALLPTTR